MPPPTIGFTRRPTSDDESHVRPCRGNPVELVKIVGIQIDSPGERLRESRRAVFAGESNTMRSCGATGGKRQLDFLDTCGFQACALGDRFAKNLQHGIRLDGDRMKRLCGKRLHAVPRFAPHQAQVVKDRRRRSVEQFAAERGLNDRRCFVQRDSTIEDVHIQLASRWPTVDILLRGGQTLNRNVSRSRAACWRRSSGATPNIRFFAASR